jgi:hypothetical protein
MNGYVVCRQEGDVCYYLAKGLWWYRHETSKDAWVFSEEEFQTLKKTFGVFYEKPTHYFTAEFNGKQTIVHNMFMVNE